MLVIFVLRLVMSCRYLLVIITQYLFMVCTNAVYTTGNLARNDDFLAIRNKWQNWSTGKNMAHLRNISTIFQNHAK